MSDRDHAIDDTTMKLGLLMESVQAHQKLAESHMEQLRAHTRDLDAVVRDEIRRTLIEELQSLWAECKQAARALQRIRRGATVRAGLWSIVIAILCTGIPMAIMRWALPSGSEVTALRALRSSRGEGAASIGGIVARGRDSASAWTERRRLTARTRTTSLWQVTESWTGLPFSIGREAVGQSSLRPP
jgi:hypothetical protein